MSAINRLPAVSTLSASDALALASAGLGGDAKATLTTLVAFLTDQGFGGSPVYRGAVANESVMLGLDADIGDKVSRTDLSGEVFELTALPASTLSNWLPYPAPTKAVGTAPFGSIVTVDSDAAEFQPVIATTDFALLISGTPIDGQVVKVRVLASGGTRNMTLGVSFRIPSSSTATSPVPIVSGTKTLFGFVWDASASLWDVVSLVPGY